MRDARVRLLRPPQNGRVRFRWRDSQDRNQIKNRERFMKADIAAKFFERVVEQARSLDLMSDEHFTVDGTLLEACAGLKSFQRVDAGEPPPADDPGNPTVVFMGNSARTRRMPLPPIRTRCWRVRVPVKKRN